MEWAQTYAAALTEAAGRPVVITDEEVAAVLDLARLVAHGTERRNAPLAAFLAGTFVEARRAAGFSAQEALDEAGDLASRLVGPTG